MPAAVPRGAQAVGRADRGVEAGLPAALRLGRRRHQAPVRHPGDVEPHAGRGAHRHRGGPAPDVGGPVLPLQAPAARGAPRAASAPWATGCPTAMGVQAGQPGQARGQHRRRRLLRDEQPGARHVLHREPARSRPSSSTTAATAWCGSGSASSTRSATSPIDLPGHPGLGQARRGLRLRGPPRHQAERGGARAREDAQHARRRWSWTSAWTRTSACSRWCRRAGPTRT